MPGGLPEGLVTSTEAIQGDIERVDRVVVEDIQQLWKVYSTNKYLIANDVGRRLENFFWRIWSNRHIRDNIRGSQVAVLFHRISEGDVIRTTPTPSPRTTRFLPILSQDQNQDVPSSPRERSRPTTAIRDVGPTQGQYDATAMFPGDKTVMSTTPEASIPLLEKGKRRESAKLPPILKKPSAGSSTQLPKTARILTPTWKPGNRGQRHDDEASSPSSTSMESDDGSDEGLEMHTTSLLTHDGGSSEDERSVIVQGLRPSLRPASSSARMDMKSSGKAGKKKPAFVASTATTKRRPSVGRRKSSQSSSSNASKTASPRLTGQERASLSSPLPPRLSSSSRRESSQLGRSRSSNSNLPNIPERYLESIASSRVKSRPSSSRPSRSASPVSSSQKTFQQASLGDLAPKTNEEISNPSLQDWLVDRDFRSKFVNSRNTSQAASPATQISYMSAIGSRSTTAPQNVLKGKGKMTDADFTDETVLLKTLGESSSAIDSDDEEDLPTLPRTKSQLTTLFERQKQQQIMNKGKGRMTEPKPGIPSAMVARDDEETILSAPLTKTKGRPTLAAEDERRRETESKDRKEGKGRKKHSH